MEIRGDLAFVGYPTDLDQAISGSVYVFRRLPNGLWAAETKLVSALGKRSLGERIDFFGDTLVAGASTDELYGANSGAAHIWRRTAAGSWFEIGLLSADGTPGSTSLGSDVALAEGRVLVGASGDDSLAGNAGLVREYGLRDLLHGSNEISLAVGGTQDLSVRVGPEHGGSLFVVLGSLSGSSPGFVDPHFGLAVPINVDAYANLLVGATGAGLVSPWFGVLDPWGRGQSRFTLPPGTSASFAGVSVTHACIIFTLPDLAPVLATDAVTVTLTN
ncbi:MAG: hypothetical protein R3F34_10305 [Planctomycetota bacterium]